ncbi:MAG: PilZ domain-containing protein [Desulfobacteraceae bacterium]
MEQDRDEKRRHTRVDFLTSILLRSKGSEILASGNSKDLSLKGVFVSTEKKLEKGTTIEVEIILSGSGKTIELFMEAVVARVEPHGLGIDFKTMELDTYTHLKNIVLYNKQEHDEI